MKCFIQGRQLAFQMWAYPSAPEGGRRGQLLPLQLHSPGISTFHTNNNRHLGAAQGGLCPKGSCVYFGPHSFLGALLSKVTAGERSTPQRSQEGETALST